MNKYIAKAYRHKKLIIAFNILLILITILNLISVQKIWIAKARLILPKSTGDLNASLGTLGNISVGRGVVFSQQLNSLKILASIMISRDVLRKIWEQDLEKELYPDLASYEKLFGVSPQSESTIIEVDIEASSPELAKLRAERLIAAFQERLKRLRLQQGSQRTDFLLEELQQAQQNLQEVEFALNDYKSSVNLVNSDIQAQEILSAIKTLTTEKSNLLAQIKASETKVQELSSSLQMTPEMALKSLRLGENSEYLSLQQELAQIETNLNKARAKFFDNSPQVESLLAEKEKLSRQLQKYGEEALIVQTSSNRTANSDSSILIQELILAKSEAQESKQKVQELQAEINRLNQELQRFPSKQKRLVELERRYNIAKGVHNGLVAQMQETKLNGFSFYPNVQLLDAPYVASSRTKPSKRLIILGALLTASFSNSAIVLFLNKHKSRLDITISNLTNLDIPVLAKIPELKNPLVDIQGHEKAQLELQRLALATSLMNLKDNLLMITSTTSGEGKTTITLGLAYALVRLGFKVLVVDGDYHKAELSKRFINFQENEVPLLSQKPVLIDSNLYLLPAVFQNNNFLKYIASGGFINQIKTLKQSEEYDYVLIDTSPFSSSEALVMSQMIGNILSIIRPGITNSDDLYQTIKQVVEYKCQIKGMIINSYNYQEKSYLNHNLPKLFLSEN